MYNRAREIVRVPGNRAAEQLLTGAPPPPPWMGTGKESGGTRGDLRLKTGQADTADGCCLRREGAINPRSIHTGILEMLYCQLLFGVGVLVCWLPFGRIIFYAARAAWAVVDSRHSFTRSGRHSFTRSNKRMGGKLGSRERKHTKCGSVERVWRGPFERRNIQVAGGQLTADPHNS